MFRIAYHLKSTGILVILVTFLSVSMAWAVSEDELLCERILIPSVFELRSTQVLQPQHVNTKIALLSPAMTDTWLFLGRKAVAFPDFKFISDLEPVKMTETEKRQIIQDAKQMRRRLYDRLIANGHEEKRAVAKVQTAYARYVINHLFKIETGLQPFHHELIEDKWRLNSTDVKFNAAFEHVEKTWQSLAKKTPSDSDGSLLPSPFPVMIAGGRFRESYYWDSYFGSLGLMLTGREELVAGQLENFLHMIQVYGRIPNGFRDYYLSRSQPPVVNQMVMMVYERTQDKKWLADRVYPLLRHDYENFWMKLRYDASTGLNFHSDDFNSFRPERHANDDERKLGVTPRDVRAEAESGLDHTDATMGESSKMATVMLNSLLYKYELDLARIAEIAGDPMRAEKFKRAAEKRKFAMSRYLWDQKSGVFRNYHLEKKIQSPVVSADNFSALYVGVATPEQAKRVASFAFLHLEKDGGIASSTSQSGKQWDGNHGWAPFQVMAIQGLANYGMHTDANRLAWKWVKALAQIHARTGHFFEKIDVKRIASPIEDGSKYPTQTGFLWTNSSYVWALRFLGFNFIQK